MLSCPLLCSVTTIRVCSPLRLNTKLSECVNSYSLLVVVNLSGSSLLVSPLASSPEQLSTLSNTTISSLAIVFRAPYFEGKILQTIFFKEAFSRAFRKRVQFGRGTKRGIERHHCHANKMTTYLIIFTSFHITPFKHIYIVMVFPFSEIVPF